MSNRTVSLRFFLLISCLFNIYSPAHSQTYLFSNFSEDFSFLDTSQVAILQKYQDPEAYILLKRLSIASISSALIDGKISVDLPWEECGIVDFKTQTIEYQSSDNYFWYGMMVAKDTCECAGGSMLLYVSGGTVNGEIQIEDRFYSIKPLGDGEHILAQHGPSPDWELDCEGTPDSISTVNVEDRDPGDFCVVKVQFVVSENAAAAMGSDYQTKIILQMHRASQVLRNSKVPESALRYVLVGIEVVPGTLLMETADMSPANVRHAFEGLLISPSSNWAKDLEQTNEFDIAIILVDLASLSPSPSATAGGRVSCMISSHINDKYYVFEHEIGHLLGAGHERCNAKFSSINCIPGEPPGLPPYPARAFPFYKCKREKEKHKRHTVVYSSSSEGVAIPYYSNPNILYNGTALGSVEFENNSLRITDRACAVANYYTADQTGDFYPVIEGLDEGICEYRFGVLTGFVTGDAGPFAYSWAVSTDGGLTFAPRASSNNILYEYTGATTDYAGSYFVVRLTVTKQSVAKTVFKTIKVIDQNEPICGGINRKKPFLDSNTGNKIIPNPSSSGSFKILVLDAEHELNVGFRVSNLMGMVVGEGWNQMVSPTQNEISIHLENSPPGIYICEIYHNGVLASTHKVIVQ